MELTVIARAKAKPGREGDVEKELRRCVGPTHKEAGCLRYAIHRGADDPQTFVVVERWKSKEALDEHLRSEHVQKLFSAMGALLAGPAEILSYQLLPEGGEKGTF